MGILSLQSFAKQTQTKCKTSDKKKMQNSFTALIKVTNAFSDICNDFKPNATTYQCSLLGAWLFAHKDSSQ